MVSFSRSGREGRFASAGVPQTKRPTPDLAGDEPAPGELLVSAADRLQGEAEPVAGARRPGRALSATAPALGFAVTAHTKLAPTLTTR